MLERFPDIKRLTPTEKLALIKELWEDLEANLPETLEQVAELDRRMEDYWKCPTKVTSWEAIQVRLLKSIN